MRGKIFKEADEEEAFDGSYRNSASVCTKHVVTYTLNSAWWKINGLCRSGPCKNISFMRLNLWILNMTLNNQVVKQRMLTLSLRWLGEVKFTRRWIRRRLLKEVIKSWRYVHENAKRWLKCFNAYAKKSQDEKKFVNGLFRSCGCENIAWCTFRKSGNKSIFDEGISATV